MLPAVLWLGLTTLSAASYNFTAFEDELFPKWKALFSVGPANNEGKYSLHPVVNPEHNFTSLYGATDMVYAMHATGQLAEIPRQQREQWARTINSFQNQSSGWYELQKWEGMHTANECMRLMNE